MMNCKNLLGFFSADLKIFLHWIYDDDLVYGLTFVSGDNHAMETFF